MEENKASTKQIKVSGGEATTSLTIEDDGIIVHSFFKKESILYTDIEKLELIEPFGISSEKLQIYLYESAKNKDQNKPRTVYFTRENIQKFLEVRDFISANINRNKEAGDSLQISNYSLDLLINNISYAD